MSRPAIPREVLRQLRHEVGFVCPVPGCTGVYLTWHHFDPPWRIEQHHRPEGLIALCRIHADQADGGAFTVEQLRAMKTDPSNRDRIAAGEFNWLRNDLLVALGSCFFYETLRILRIGTRSVVEFERDENGNLLLNLVMPSRSPEVRARVVRNVWTVEPGADELIAPPIGGRTLEVRYRSGDHVRLEFSEVESAEQMRNRFPAWRDTYSTLVSFPITVVAIHFTVAATDISFTPYESLVPGMNSANMFCSRVAKVEGTAGIHLEVDAEFEAKLFPDVG